MNMKMLTEEPRNPAHGMPNTQRHGRPSGTRQTTTSKARHELPKLGLLEFALAWILAVLFPLSVHAAKPLVVHMPIVDTPPYGWLDAQGQAQGLLPDIVAALATQTNLKIKVDMVPYARAVRMLETNSADASLLFSVTKDPSAAATTSVEQIMVVFLNRQVVQLRPGLRVSSRADLADLQIGRKIGGCQELIDDKSFNWHFNDYVSHDGGLKMLLLGRLDGLCSADEVLDYAIESAGLKVALGADKAQRFVLGLRPVWLVVSARLPQPLREKLTNGIQQLQTNGHIGRIFKARLGAHYVVDLPK